MVRTPQYTILTLGLYKLLGFGSRLENKWADENIMIQGMEEPVFIFRKRPSIITKIIHLLLNVFSLGLLWPYTKFSYQQTWAGNMNIGGY